MLIIRSLDKVLHSFRLLSVAFSLKTFKKTAVFSCLCLGFLSFTIRLTRQCSLFGRFFCSRWIRFFISSCIAYACIRCENQKNRDSSRFFLSLHHSHAWIHWRHCWCVFFNVCYCCFCCQDH